jgi:hypothetical protein
LIRIVNYDKRSSRRSTFRTIAYLLRVVFVQLGLATRALPKAQYFVLRAVRHVNDPFVPPPLHYRSVHGPVDAINPAGVFKIECSDSVSLCTINSLIQLYLTMIPSSLTSRNMSSPEVSVPTWTVKLCLWSCLDGSGLRSMSFPC